MERTKIYTALKGIRGRKSIDLKALEQMLVRFAQMIAEQPWIKELDINPLLASPEQLLALDARVVLHDASTNENELPQLAIRPYPSQYVSYWTAKDGSQVIFRPVRAEDEPRMVEFHHSLSDRSVYLRFMRPVLLSDRAAHERLSRICHGDYNREIALVAERADARPGELQIMGASRMTRMHNTNIARFSMLISDCCQGMGLGSELFNRLVNVARQEKFERLETMITPDNRVMRHLCEKNGFTIIHMENENILKAQLTL